MELCGEYRFKYTIYYGKKIISDLFSVFNNIVASSGRATLDDCIRLGWKQNPEIKNSALRIKGARADYVASIGAFLPRAVVDVTTGRRYGRSIDPVQMAIPLNLLMKGASVWI